MSIWKFPHYHIGEPLDWEELSANYDWIEEMKSVPQDALWHAEGDVFTHTKMVVEALMGLPEFETFSDQTKQLMVTAALLHDVEKRSTTTTEIIDGKERIISPRHAKRGEFTTRRILYKDIPTPFFIREMIAKLVRWHGLPIWAITKENPAKEVIYASQIVDTRLLYLLAKADLIGRVSEDKDEFLLNIEMFKELCLENDCFGRPREFKSEYGRFLYFNKKESSPDYEPFDDLKGEVIVMCALPGSGKDTYIKNHLDYPVLSLDDIRREHKIDPTDKKKNGLVIQLAKEQAKVYLRKQTPFVYNATNITADMRRKWISLFLDYGAKVTIVYVEVPYKQLLKQNASRDYKVPVSVIDKLLDKLEMPDCREAHVVKQVVRE